MPSLRMAVAYAVVVVSMAAWGTAQEPDNRETAQPATAEKIAAVVNGKGIPEAELAAVVERQLQGRQIPPEALQKIRRENHPEPEGDGPAPVHRLPWPPRVARQPPAFRSSPPAGTR